MQARKFLLYNLYFKLAGFPASDDNVNQTQYWQVQFLTNMHGVRE